MSAKPQTHTPTLERTLSEVRDRLTMAQDNSGNASINAEEIEMLNRAITEADTLKKQNAALLGYVKDLLEFEQARMSSHGLKNYPRASIEYNEGIKKLIAASEEK